MRNLDWTCLIEKLGARRIHTVMNHSGVEFVLLTASASQILSVLCSHSKSILLNLILHKLSVEESRVSCRSQRLDTTLNRGSSIQTIYCYALSLSLSENSKVVYQLAPTFRTLISSLHLLSRHCV